jgi:hypothetical protein
VVRQRFAKPPFPGSNPGAASKIFYKRGTKKTCINGKFTSGIAKNKFDYPKRVAVLRSLTIISAVKFLIIFKS